MDSDSSGSPLLSLACRFLPHDQWFTTHVDPDWKVRQVKSWLLSKCLPYAAPPSPPLRQSTRKPQRAPSPITFAPDPRHRPISPITFAMPKQAPVPSDASDEEGRRADDDEISEPDEVLPPPIAPPQHQKRRTVVFPTAVSASGPKGDLFAQYTLLRFSTGQLLEDDLPLSFYDMQPDELLELHRLGVIVTLPRAHPRRYLDAYWEGWVRVLRMRPLEDEEDAWPLYKVRQNETRLLEWRDRWLVVREGIVYLCRDEARLIHTLSLTDLIALTNANALPASATPPSATRILLARFASPANSSAPASYGPTRASSPLLSHATSTYVLNNNNNTNTNTNTLHTPAASASIASTYSHAASTFASASTSTAFTDPFASDASSPSSSALSSPVFAHEHESSGSAAERQRRSAKEKRRGRKMRGRARKKGPEHEFLALDLKDDSAYVSLLRVLHRHTLPASTFVAALPVAASTGTSPLLRRDPNALAGAGEAGGDADEDEDDDDDAPPPLRHPPSLAQLHLHLSTHSGHGHGDKYASSLGALPFPEWRSGLLRRARRSGSHGWATCGARPASRRRGAHGRSRGRRHAGPRRRRARRSSGCPCRSWRRRTRR
ncbi:hypothetical protein B0H11DRAFT_1257801 [Mycena galericulata]|nr:hypothetical protein B0H11DRAFT_1257801 [Mycena galericulata]